MAVLKAHFAVPESREFVRAVRALSSARTVMRLFNADELPSAD